MSAFRSSMIHIKILTGLGLFLAVLSLVSAASNPQTGEVNSLAPRAVPPPPKVVSPPKPKNPKPVPPAVGGTRKLAQKVIKELLERIEGGQPPAVEGKVEIPDSTPYPDDASLKNEKRKAPKGPDGPDGPGGPDGPETGQACAGEECGDTQSCVHMAGRRFWVKWFTCCPKGKFADYHGNCCKKKLDAKHTLCA